MKLVLIQRDELARQVVSPSPSIWRTLVLIVVIGLGSEIGAWSVVAVSGVEVAEVDPGGRVRLTVNRGARPGAPPRLGHPCPKPQGAWFGGRRAGGQRSCLREPTSEPGAPVGALALRAIDRLAT